MWPMAMMLDRPGIEREDDSTSSQNILVDDATYRASGILLLRKSET